LLSGNHTQIANWRREQAILRTLERRPELLDKANLSSEERRLVERSKNCLYEELNYSHLSTLG